MLLWLCTTAAAVLHFGRGLLKPCERLVRQGDAAAPVTWQALILLEFVFPTNGAVQQGDMIELL